MAITYYPLTIYCMERNHKNYLKTVRLETGLSQEEVAYMLGLKSTAYLCRLEQRKCAPSIRIILGCRILYKATLDAIIPAYMKDIEEEVCERANTLLTSLRKKEQTPLIRQKINSLRRIVAQMDKTAAYDG